MWFAIALIGYFLLGLVVVLDKFILTKSMGRPSVYTFYSTIFLVGLFLLVPFGVKPILGRDLMVCVFSGGIYILALWTLYIAIKKGETSHIVPFNGALTALFLFLFSPFLFDDFYSIVQLIGAGILIFSAFLLSFEKTNKAKNNHADLLWGALSAMLFTLSLLAQKYIYNQYDFFSSLVWLQGSCGVLSFLLLFDKHVRSSFLSLLGIRQNLSKKISKSFGKKHLVSIVVANKILSAVALLLVQYAISIGSVALVSSLGGAQYVFTFCIIFLLTKFTPKLLKEYFTKRELFVETIAIILVVIGSALLGM